MSPRSRPAGKTFKERWPHEVEETRYFASTSYAVVVGGVLGVLLVPLAIWDAASAAPLAAAGSIVIAYLADRGGNALRRRTPTPVAPR